MGKRLQIVFPPFYVRCFATGTEFSQYLLPLATITVEAAFTVSDTVSRNLLLR